MDKTLGKITVKIIDLFDFKPSISHIRNALKLGINLDVPNENGTPALVLAVMNNLDLDIFQALIKAGANLNSNDRFNRTALIWASILLRKAMFKILLESGADTSIKDFEDKTALLHALIENADLEVIELLLKYGSKVNERDKIGRTALMYAAAFASNKDVIKLLLKNGANIQARANNGLTALFYATKYNQCPEIIRYLLTKQKNSKSAYLNGETVLNFSIKTNPGFQFLKAFSNKQLDIKAKDKIKNTALICSVIKNRSLICSLLLFRGANPNIKNAYGRTALMYAANGIPDPKETFIVNIDGYPDESGQHYVFQTVRKPNSSAISALIRNGTDVNLQDKFGWTALMFATANRSLRTVKLLLNAGADPNLASKSKKNALQIAFKLGSLKTVETLINAGTKIKFNNSKGISPLMFASLQHWPQIISALIKKGVNVNDKDHQGKTSLMHVMNLNLPNLNINSNPVPKLPLSPITRREYFIKIFCIKKFDTDSGRNRNSRYKPKSMFGLMSGKEQFDENLFKSDLEYYQRQYNSFDLLLKAGAKINDQDSEGMSPLMHAILNRPGDDNELTITMRERPEKCKSVKTLDDIISVLIKAGADVNAKNKAGETPLKIAKKLNQKIIVELLIRSGATLD